MLAQLIIGTLAVVIFMMVGILLVAYLSGYGQKNE